MIRNVERSWFEVWGSEQAQNKILKGLLALTITLNVVQTMALVILSYRPPALFLITPEKSERLLTAPLTKEFQATEVRRALTSFLAFRHHWNWSNVESGFKNASNFVEASYVKKFLEANVTQIRTAKAKKLSQEFYLTELLIDAPTRSAHVTGERILIVENLSAVTRLEFNLTYVFGQRTEANPEGVYVTSETLIPSSTDALPSGGAK